MNNIDLMRSRLRTAGGEVQQARMIKAKRDTLDRVVLYSYQGAKVRKLDSDEVAPALINPNVVKQDYDDKIISIGFEYGFEPGTVFSWLNTGTQWLIYLQELTELAYFKGNIRKCTYVISWQDEDGNIHSTPVALKGPKEANIISITRDKVNYDIPNHSLNILMPKNKDTLEYFTRYSRFFLQGEDVCWRVEGTDSISTPGILEINAVEYYANEDTDDIENGIAGGLIVEPIPPEPTTAEIEGEIFIRPKKTYVYRYLGTEAGNWHYDSKLPIAAEVNGNEISLKWTTTYTGQFELSFGNITKTIVVESLF